MQRFEFNDDKSSKFWQIEQRGSELHIAWGKLGTNGQSQVKNFDGDAKAEAAKAKLIAEKTGKGYVAEGAAPATAAPASAPSAPSAPAATAAAPATKAALAPSAVATPATKPAANAAKPLPPTQAASAEPMQPQGIGAAAAEPVLAAANHPSGNAPAADSSAADRSAADSGADAPATPREQVAAWLDARRASPSLDQQALVAWRAMLTAMADEAERAAVAGMGSTPMRLATSPGAGAKSDLSEATSATLQKRFGIDAQVAGLVLAWRASCIELPATAADWLANAQCQAIEPAMAQQWQAAWAPLNEAEPAQAWPARFGQFMPMAPTDNVPAPVVGDTEPAAWAALHAMWPASALLQIAESDAELAPAIARLNQRMAEGAAGDADVEIERLLLAVALGEGLWHHQFKRTHGELPIGMRQVASQLWHYLRLAHPLPVRMAMLIWAMQHHVHVPYKSKHLAIYATDCLNVGPDNRVLGFMQQDLNAATPQECDACEALLWDDGVHGIVLPVLALLFGDVRDLSAKVLAHMGPLNRYSTVLLLAVARDAAVRDQLLVTADAHFGLQNPNTAVRILTNMGPQAWTLLEKTLGDYSPSYALMARLNHPDALAALMRNADASSEVRVQLQLALARWPLAGMVAAAQLARSGGKHATLAQGLVRQLLPTVAPVLDVLQPWLSAPTWRWLSQLSQASDEVSLAEPAELAAQLPVLANPPWLKKRKPQSGAPQVQPLPVAHAVLDWSEAEKTDMLADMRMLLKNGLPVEHMARGLLANYWGNEKVAEVLDWARAISAGDADALIASWQTKRDHSKQHAYWSGYLHGTYIARLPQAVGLPFWQHVVTAIEIEQPEAVLAHWGVPAMPGMVALAQHSPAAVADLFHRLGAVELAPLAARQGFQGKAPKARAVGQRWLLQWPEHASAALIAPAIGATGAAQEAAAMALRFLVANGHAAVVQAVVARCGDPAVIAALQAVLDQDPLDLFPVKFAKAMPDFWQPQAWQRPQLHSGGALPDAALTALGQMLSFARPDGAYAGFEQVKAACTPQSLGAFAWDLFTSWLAAGAAAKDNWAFTALGMLGDELCVQRLRTLMANWPTEGASARAALGLTVLAEVGSDSALRVVADMAERDKLKGLKVKATELLEQVAAERGMGLEDLQDRLIPGMGLDERGLTTLDYGPRQFLLALDENLKPWLRKLEADGKPGARLRSLPVKNAADDAVLAQAASERFKAIKSQCEAIAKVQLKRLEQAMVAGRRWRREDFEMLYVRQPLMRQLASRVIWGVFEDHADAANAASVQSANIRQLPERLLQLVRLADDGELTTADDDAWAWPESDDAQAGEGEGAPTLRIGIAHPLELSDADLAAFGQLLADYELMQPFEQLARAGARAPQERADAAGEQRAAKVAQLMAQGAAYSPGRFLALKTRGWALATDDGYTYSGAHKELASGLALSLSVSPGVSLYEVRSAPPQSLDALRLSLRQRETSWADLDAISYSELMRDLAYLTL